MEQLEASCVRAFSHLYKNLRYKKKHANQTPGTPQDVVNDSTDCNMSQVSEFLKSLNTAMPVFGVTFLVGNFIFLVAWCVTFITAIFCGNPTACLGQEIGDVSGGEFYDNSLEERQERGDVFEMSERKLTTSYEPKHDE